MWQCVYIEGIGDGKFVCERNRVRLYRAAATITKESSYSVSNLALHKLLYLSHMLTLGHESLSLVEGFKPFQAWDFGPVQPDLYHKIKGYGSKPLPNLFPQSPFVEGDVVHKYIKEVMNQVGDRHPGRLVAITYCEKGAWAKRYKRGIRSIEITDEDILEEFQTRSK